MPHTLIRIRFTLDSVNIVNLLIRYGADVNAKDYLRETPLFFTNGAGNFPKFSMNSLWTQTELYQFIWSGDGKVAELLIENGAHINAVNYDGMTILQSAAANGNSEDELGMNQFPQINSYSCRQFSFG